MQCFATTSLGDQQSLDSASQSLVRRHLLEVLGFQSSVLRKTREHPWSDLLAIMEREYDIWPTFAGKRLV